MTKIKIKKKKKANAGEDAEKQDWSYTPGGNIKWHNHSGKRVRWFLTKTNVLTIQPSNCPLGCLYQRNRKFMFT